MMENWDDDEKEDKKGSSWFLFILIGVIFLPGLILAVILWSLLRFFKQRPSVVGLVSLIISVISVIVFLVSFNSVTSQAHNVADNINADTVGGFSVLLAPLWLSGSLVLGAISGWLATVFYDRQMRRNPYLTELSGNWQYKFKYRRTPWEFFSRKKKIRSLKNSLLVENNKAPMGLDEKTDEVVFRYDSEARKHTFVTGASGSGKTITIQNLIHSDIEVGKTVVVVDFKRSPKFASKLARWAKEHDAGFYHFVNGDTEDYDIPDSEGQCTYDPLKSGTAGSKADMVLGMREYDSNAAVYKAAMQQLLQVTFAMLRGGDPRRQVTKEIGKEALLKTKNIDWVHGGIKQLASVVSGNGFYELAAANCIELQQGETKHMIEIPGKQDENGNPKLSYVNSPVAKNAIELGEALRSKGPLVQAYQELQGQMRTIIASEYGQWITTDNKGDAREIDLMELTSQDGNVILFSLNSDSEPEFAQYVGSMIFSDLTNISALRRNKESQNQVNVYVDEFQAVPPSAVTSLLEKSRESKMALTISQQSFDQVVASADYAGEAYLNSILDTCSNFIAHAGSTEKSATRLSEILGKEQKTVYSRMNESKSSFLSFNWKRAKSSRVSARQEERWVFPPSGFMKLSSPDKSNNQKSTAVYITKTSADPEYSEGGGATARTVWVVPADVVLEENYQVSAGKNKNRSQSAKKTEFTFDDFEKEQRNQSSVILEGVDSGVEELTPDEQFDEEWNFEDIDENSQNIEDNENSVEDAEDKPFVNGQDFSLDDLFDDGGGVAPKPKKKTTDNSLPAVSQQKKTDQTSSPVRKGLPVRPGGLPTRKPQQNTEKENPLPEI